MKQFGACNSKCEVVVMNSFIKKIFYTVFFLFLNESSVYSQKITMRIEPQYRMVVGLYEYVTVVIEGVRKDQITYRSEVVIYQKDFSYVHLMTLKKFNYIESDACLCVKKSILNKNRGWETTDIKLSKDTLDRLLKYLLYDSEDKNRDCADFFQEVLFDSKSKNEFKKSDNFYIFSENDEKNLKAGDGVVLQSDGITQHYAIYLGDGLYISKYGCGGPLVVQTMKTMLARWKSNFFFTLDVEAYKKN